MNSRPTDFARNQAAALMAVVLVGSILHAYFGWTIAGACAAPALVAYIALTWPRLRLNARVMVSISAIAGLWTAWSTGLWGAVGSGFVRACFYPAFLAALGFLRDAAASSPMVERAGRYLVDQPPGRRYVALAFGGHIFGILLNIGGLALLASMLRQVNTLESAGGDARRLEIREKRMTLAVLRGFHSMAMWCPLSVTVALLFSLTPDAHWRDYAPYGLGMTFIFLALGWLFDFLTYPRATAKLGEADPQGWRAAVAMIAQVVAITAIAFGMERITGVSFTVHVLVVVPLFALGWMVVQYKRLGLVEAIGLSAASLASRAAQGFPAYANEMALFFTSAFLGSLVPLLLPADLLPRIIADLHLTPNALSVLIVLAVAGLSFVGINPMITITLLIGSLAHSPAAGLSPLKLILTTIGAWSMSNGMSPLNGSMVLLGGVMQRPSETIAFKWNGAFATTALALFCLVIYFLPI